VRRGSSPTTTVVARVPGTPGVGEVLVQVVAAALTPTDALLCSAAPSLADQLLQLPSPPAPVVPGLIFCGEVLALGPFVEGLSVGESVLGVVDGSAWEASSSGAEPPAAGGGGGGGERERFGVQGQGQGQGEGDGEVCGGGCFREQVCIHFSGLWPASELVEGGLHLPSVVSLLPGMLAALFCATSRLRLQAGEALLLIAPQLSEVILLLQRLLLLSDSWAGPLYLIVLQGPAPTREDLMRHPLLRPLLGSSSASAAGDASDGGGAGGRGFLSAFAGFSASAEANAPSVPSAPSSGPPPAPKGAAEALPELVQRVLASTQGAGVDAILSLDLDLGPPALGGGEAALLAAVAAAVEAADRESPRPGAAGAQPPKRQATLLRTLIGALALRGRLLTSCRRVEMMPADSEHLWAKEGSLSFFNPHCLALSAAQQGSLMHAMAEVTGRLLDREVPSLAASEVSQFRMFEQFQLALEALRSGSTDRTAATSAATAAGVSTSTPTAAGAVPQVQMQAAVAASGGSSAVFRPMPVLLV